MAYQNICNRTRNIRELIPRIWKVKFGANPLKSDLDE